jgi:hypothetical protein
MTGDGAVLDFCGSLPDGNGIYDLAAPIFEDAKVHKEVSLVVIYRLMYVSPTSRENWRVSGMTRELCSRQTARS